MKNFALAVAAIALVSCGTTVKNNTSSTTTGAGGSGSVTGVGTGTGNGATSGAGGGSNAVTLTMDSFDVAPGQEVYYCQDFANPFGGVNVDISEFESHMTKGSHHMILFYKPGATNGPLTPCSGLEFAASPYGSQQPDDSITYPKGVAAGFPATYGGQSLGIRLQSHYLNVTGQTIHALVQVKLHPVDPSTVTAIAGVLFLVQPNFAIPPNSSQKVTFDCNLPQDMSIIRANSHMHSHGTDFMSTLAGQPFYNTTTWNEPQPATYSPAIQAKLGDPLHFECNFVNNGSTTLTFGESALTNEMCILSATFYPATAPTIDCQPTAGG